MAVFDFSTSPPDLPFPTDILLDPATGLINIPIDSNATETAETYLASWLNTLNGWPTIIPGEVKFTGLLDKATITNETFIVLEMDPSNPTQVTPVTDVSYEYKETGQTSLVRIYPQGGKWKRGTRYVVFVVGGAAGVKDKNSKPVYPMPYFEVATGDSPLCAWDRNKSWDSSTKSCADPIPGAPATGCCTFSYNSVIDTATKEEIRAQATDDMSLEEVERLAKQTALERVTQFEQMRRNFDQMLAVANKFGVSRKDVAVLWSFKTVEMNQAVFDPTATPPQGPFPTDMVKNPQTGLLAIPVDPNLSKAEQDFYAYLNTLDGFPMSFPGTVAFTEGLDTDSTDNGVLVFALDMTATPPTAKKLDNVVVTHDPTKNLLTVVRRGGLEHGKTHVMVSVGGTSGLKNKDTTYAASPVRTAYMHLVLSPHPLCESYDAATATCKGDPTVSVFVDDPDFVPNGQTAREKAAQSEAVRVIYDPLMKTILAADSSLQREDISAMWAFSTTTMTMVNIDPENGHLPYPSDLMLDAKTGLIAIPEQPGETPAEKALRLGLNTLDGGTTQGTFYVPVAGKLDPASTAEPQAALTLDITLGIPTAAPMTVAADNTAGALTFKPVSPLGEKRQFAVVLTSKRKDGTLASQGGLKDEKGNYVVPSSSMVLLRGENPVYDAATKKSLVSFLDDKTAEEVEKARLEAQQMIGPLGLMGINREDVIGAWTMKTMSITQEMMGLRALPYDPKTLAVTDQNKPKLAGALDKTLAGWPTTYMDAPKTSVAGMVSGTYKSWWLIDPTTDTFTEKPGSAVEVPFVLTVPAGTEPLTGWPVVIYIHSMFHDKFEALAVASANAAKGMATLAFDLPYHGGRSWCVKDEECDGGTCDVKTGTCSTKLADKDQNGFVDASGNDRFLNLQNPFAIRDNLRQAVIDASALLRAVVTGGASGITGGPVKLDPTKVTVAGSSTGAAIATDWLAVEGNTVRGALHSPGLRLAEIFLSPDGGKAWETLRKGMLQAQGITEGSIEALRLVTTFTWIMERADPGNFARHVSKVPLNDLLKAPGTKVPAKTVILQQAESDAGTPLTFSDALAKEIGVDTTKTLFKGQGSSMIKLGDPDQTATEACRTQMATFLKAGTVCTPVYTGGKYTGACQ
jgi:hypothetical protein